MKTLREPESLGPSTPTSDRATERHIVASRDNSAGLRWYWQLAVFSAAVLIIISRQPDAISNPQFWAEDGHTWFAQAYNLGWLKALFLQDGGYLNTFQRLIAGLALLVPFHSAPLLMNLFGAAAQALPVTVLLSSGLSGFGSLKTRALWAALYLLLPNGQEIQIHITNAPWHLALAACLVVLAAPPATRIGRICETTLLLLSGLSGPFCLFLLGIGFALYWRKPHRWRQKRLFTLITTSLIQIVVLLYAGPAERAHSLGATAKLFITLVSGHVYTGALLGSNALAHFSPFGILLAVFCCGSLFLLYTAWKASLEIRLLIAFCLTTFAACLASPIYSTNYDRPAWLGLILFMGCRYWFFPMLAFVWSLAWCARTAPSKSFKVAGSVLLIVMVFGVIREYRYPPLRDENFPVWSYRFEHAKAGAHWQIPAPPDSRWTIQLTKK